MSSSNPNASESYEQGSTECGCTLVLGKAGIRYCSLHLAAPAMLAALANTLDGLRNIASSHIKGDCFNPGYKDDPCRCSLCVGKRAIAQARGEPAHA